MGRQSETAIAILDARGGRNGGDPPLSLPDTQLAEAMNVDFWEGTLAHKRLGAEAVSLTCSSGGPFALVATLLSHLPTADLTALELWAFDISAQVFRLAASTSWVELTPSDAIEAPYYDVTGASAQGWLFLCYNSAVNRLHVWDGTSLRRVGLSTPGAAPTLATIVGSGPTFTRHYRVRWAHIVGADTIRRSEAGASASHSIAAQVGIRVTRPTAAGDGETHWEVEYAEAALGPWYRAAQVAIGTTTYDDTAAQIDTTNLTASAGAHTAPTSWKYIVHDQGRLLGAGAWETPGRHSRVWFTAQLGSSEMGDLERVPMTTDFQNWVDLDEHDGGFITGFGGPMDGAVYVFKYRQIWKLVRTGNATAPYRPYPLTKAIGSVRQHAIVMAEDERGNPAIYFLSHRGPMRLGGGGLEYLGNDVEDMWESFNPEATQVTAHGLYYPAKHQIWWWITLLGQNAPSMKLVFDVRLGRTTAEGVGMGWSQHAGRSAATYTGVLFANTLGATMSRDLKPYVSTRDAVAILKCDTGTDDNGETFQAYVTTAALPIGGLLRQGQVGQPVLVANAASGVSIQATVSRDFGVETKTGSVVLTPAGSESRVLPQFEALELAGVTTVQYTIGDAAAVNNAWTLDAFVIPYTVQEPR